MPRPDKRAQIMAAVVHLIASRPWHAITTDDIARVAGVGKGTIYRHFADKDDLLLQVATSGFDELCSLLEQKVLPGDCFADQLLEACRQISGFFQQKRNLIRMMHAQDNGSAWKRGNFGPRWQASRRRLVEALAGIMAKGIEEGAVRGEMAPGVLASYLLGMMRTRARDLTDFPEEERQLEQVVMLFCHGAAPGLKRELLHVT